ncbi:hypothetical protein BASA61_004104 [Batrachochytrium salamandrivorans]|nr:hypothetical protein BASA61_004104 [Batrachochytrium salamandrivorans]
MSAIIRTSDFDIDNYSLPHPTATAPVRNYTKNMSLTMQEPSPTHSDLSIEHLDLLLYKSCTANQYAAVAAEKKIDAANIRDYDIESDDDDVVYNDLHEASDEYDDSDNVCEPVHVHWISHGDTISNIAQTYHTTTWMLGKANEFEDLKQTTLEGRRFIVIPSPSTFQEPIWDIDQERHELCRNFLILIHDDDFSLAHTYLSKSNYNLPAAIENYYFDLC